MKINLDPAQPSIDNPTKLEFILASIPLGIERQQRSIIIGNESVKQKFYELLAANGKLFYQGGTPILAIKNSKVAYYIHKAASRVPKASAIHALTIDIKRTRSGFFGFFKSGLENILGRRHKIIVYVVGTADERKYGLIDVINYVYTLQESDVIENIAYGKSGAPISIETIDTASWPIVLWKVKNLYSVLEGPLSKVRHWNNSQRQLLQEREKLNEYYNYSDDITDKEKYSEMSDHPQNSINPASGLPMVSGPSGVDIHGNTFGSDHP